MSKETKVTVYCLPEGVRIFFNTEEEIRLRKGIWNYNEAIIRLHGQEDKVRDFFAGVAAELLEKGEVEVQRLGSNVGATSEELQSFCAFLDNLKNQGFLYEPKDKEISQIVGSLVSGNVSEFAQLFSEPHPVLLVADNKYAKAACKSIAQEIKLPLDIMDQGTVSEITQLDLTTKTEAIDYLKSLEKYQELFSLYSCVISTQIEPNVILLRNLNRILISCEKPLILGFVDGPFISLLSTIANQTGCFECYEHRMHARLQDTLVYHKFIESHRYNRERTETTIFSPLLHLLAAAVLTEGFLFSTAKITRLAGRILSVYIPALEIQVQDLLRVPYCPACGFISQAKMAEMYTSSREIIDAMLKKVEIQD